MFFHYWTNSMFDKEGFAEHLNEWKVEAYADETGVMINAADYEKMPHFTTVWIEANRRFIKDAYNQAKREGQI